MSLPFLLEIGTEEIPDWMIPNALENLRLLFEKLDIPHETVSLDATPRRLVLRAEGLPERQPDREERVQGPAKSAPPQAVAGFARKQGIAPEAPLESRFNPKGLASLSPGLRVTELPWVTVSFSSNPEGIVSPSTSRCFGRHSRASPVSPTSPDQDFPCHV